MKSDEEGGISMPMNQQRSRLGAFRFDYIQKQTPYFNNYSQENTSASLKSPRLLTSFNNLQASNHKTETMKISQSQGGLSPENN